MSQRLTALPVGAKVKDSQTSYNGKPIVWQVGGHNHYASGQTVLVSEKIISLKAFDAIEASNTDSNRKNYGNNRYAHSNLRQWLNSAVTSWYAAQHSADAPPTNANVWSNYNEYDQEKGFLANFSANLRNALIPTSLTVAKNTVTDGGGSETVTDKVFLLSNTEVGLANENSIAEGKLLPLFTTADSSRLAYPTAEAVSKSEYKDTTSLTTSKAWYYWLRSPSAGYSSLVRSVYLSGALSNDNAYSGVYGVRPALNLSSDILVSDSVDSDGAYTIVWNNTPTLTVNTENNKTLYENDAFTIEGNAKDVDNGDIVSVKYSINDGTSKAITSAVSDGATPIVFSKQLVFKGGILFDGATAITSALADNTNHVLKVWAEDDKGNKTSEVVRTFTSVTNRAPGLVVDAVTPSGTIDSDSFIISGSASDPDGNDVVVTYKINSETPVEIYRGPAATWSFNVALGALKAGENTIVIDVTDTFNFKASKTVKLQKDVVRTARMTGTVRYKIKPPKGSAKTIVVWAQRSSGMTIDAFASMALVGEPESYAPMEKTNTASVSGNIVEDQFMYTADEEKQNIVTKLKITKSNADDVVTLVQGVID
ncbi:DUF6273 domain-containing protein [Kurthia populi]|uniref:DUF6273 domain-containing protein n=1 Tax=Kurthia populi TaxID=1562132 RepID=A0ABW5XWT9_9BACL